MRNYYFRCLPTTRVKEFIENYVQANYDEEDDLHQAARGWTRFTFDSGIPERTVWGFRNLQRPNVQFDVVDKMLTNLGCLHIWHLGPEEGGFADYYHADVPPAPVEPTVEQSRFMSDDSAASRARRYRLEFMDVLHERAEQEMSGVAA